MISFIKTLPGYQSGAVSVLSWSHSRLPLEKAAEEGRALEIQPVSHLIDGQIRVPEKHLGAQDCVIIEPVHYTAPALLLDDSRQIVR